MTLFLKDLSKDISKCKQFLLTRKIFMMCFVVDGLAVESQW